MIVRLLKVTDLRDWVEMAEQAFEEGFNEWGFKFDRDSAERGFFIWEANPQAINYCLERNGELVGTICGLTFPHYFNLSQWCYMEHLWYVKPELRAKGGGILLLDEAEAECRKRGINNMIMANQTRWMARHFDKLYPRLGYRKIETLWIKELT